jgi:hypothetical protein
MGDRNGPEHATADSSIIEQTVTQLLYRILYN